MKLTKADLDQLESALRNLYPEWQTVIAEHRIAMLRLLEDGNDDRVAIFSDRIISSVSMKNIEVLKTIVNIVLKEKA